MKKMNVAEMQNANGGLWGAAALGLGLAAFLCESMKWLYGIAMKSLKK